MTGERTPAQPASRLSEDAAFYLAAGPLGALVLAVALVPLREVTTASNLAFAFLVLVILAGHAGGQLPAIATAIVSALSLNFFLTKPYLTLVIHGRDDVIAFLGLLACGLVAAALGSRRGERLARRRELEVLHAAMGELEHAGPAETRVQKLLEAACAVFPVAALALRDATAAIVIWVGDRTKLDTPAAARDGNLEPRPEQEGRFQTAPLPADGIRLPLVFGNRPLGSLDIWGDGGPAGRETRRALTAVARAVAALIAAEAVSPALTPAGERPASAWVAFPRPASRE